MKQSKTTKKWFSLTSNLQSYYHFKLDFQKVDQHNDDMESEQIIVLRVFFLLSHPGLGQLYVFSSFPPRPPPPRPSPQQLMPLTSKPFELNLTYLA